jgi:hypothetical protein
MVWYRNLQEPGLPIEYGWWTRRASAPQSIAGTGYRWLQGRLVPIIVKMLYEKCFYKRIYMGGRGQKQNIETVPPGPSRFPHQPQPYNRPN